MTFSSTATGQPSAESNAPDQTAVFRTNTELVQTDVMVFDKQGRFVNGLRPEDFELRIDGKVTAISFFERIEAGTATEESQLAAARRGTARNAPVAAALSDRGRTIFFYLDDLHFDLGGLAVARKLVERFIDREMKKMATDDAEPDRLAYAADLSLADLPSGRYLLQVTILDRVSGGSASQHTRFEIE